jgi:hypothetical protein
LPERPAHKPAARNPHQDAGQLLSSSVRQEASYCGRLGHARMARLASLAVAGFEGAIDGEIRLRALST